MDEGIETDSCQQPGGGASFPAGEGQCVAEVCAWTLEAVPLTAAGGANLLSTCFRPPSASFVDGKGRISSPYEESCRSMETGLRRLVGDLRQLRKILHTQDVIPRD